MWLFLALAPRLPTVEPPEPPSRLGPWSTVRVERPGRRGDLVGTWYPAAGRPRGAVLLLPPWLEWGRTYFHRRRRLEVLREAGYHALALDFPGFGGSGPVAGFFDRDVADGLADLGRRAPDLPLHLWGVSAGGYWSHPVLARAAADRRAGHDRSAGHGGAALGDAAHRVEAAVFEDVSPHLLEWAGRMSPWARPFHRLFRLLFPTAFRFLDLRHHAPALAGSGLRLAYVGGAEDPGVPAEDTRSLARHAGARVQIVPDAGHLEAIKRATDDVLELALETFGG